MTTGPSNLITHLLLYSLLLLANPWHLISLEWESMRWRLSRVSASIKMWSYQWWRHTVRCALDCGVRVVRRKLEVIVERSLYT